MKSPKNSPATPFEVIAPFITPGVLARVSDLLNLGDEETVALIVARMIAPDRIIGQGEEAKLRGVRHETLKKYKDEKLLPALVNGK